MEKNQGQWLKVFCPGARCLSEVEVAALPEELKNQQEDQDGLWLNIFCPDESCLKENERAFRIEREETSVGREGVWLNLFCPDESCLKSEGTETT